MAFRGVNFAHLAKFNSAASSEFIDFYGNIIENKIRADLAKPSSATIAPSSFRCLRKTWFRLRNTAPDSPKQVDPVLNFTAELGTACHEMIQTNLKSALKNDWIKVSDYLKDNPIPYEYVLDEGELESKIEILDPPIRFACDGIIRWKDSLYLLEIKSSEFSSFNDLIEPKPQHIDQIKCYATILGLSNVLVLYIDRQYGSLKCYEMKVSESDMTDVKNKIDYVQRMAKCNLAPERLPSGDPGCQGCPYSKKCKEY